MALPVANMVPTITGPLLAELQTLRALQTLHLFGLSELEVDDDDIRNLGLCCPQLESMRLESGVHANARRKKLAITVTGLAALRNACPRLTYLNCDAGCTIGPSISKQIPCNVQVLQPLVLALGNGHPAPRLDSTTIALIVRILFPKLVSFMGYGPHWSVVAREWAWQLIDETCSNSESDAEDYVF